MTLAPPTNDEPVQDLQGDPKSEALRDKARRGLTKVSRLLVRAGLIGRHRKLDHCILHIGTEKTGTTTFQSFMSANRDLLLAQGILYPRSLGAESQFRLAHFARPDLPIAQESFGATSEAAVPSATIRTAIRTDFRHEIWRLPAHLHTAVLSSEHLQSRLHDLASVETLRDFLAPSFRRITVYIHLRPQLDVAVSLASTKARAGGTVLTGFFKTCVPRNPYYNYLDLVQRWAQVFGRENLRLVPFRREPDFTSVLLRDLGLDKGDFRPVERANRAIDLATILEVNRRRAEGHTGRAPNELVDRPMRGEPLRLSRDRAKSRQRAFAASNAKLIAGFAGLHPGDLTPDWTLYPETGNESLLTVPAAPGSPSKQPQDPNMSKTRPLLLMHLTKTAGGTLKTALASTPGLKVEMIYGPDDRRRLKESGVAGADLVYGHYIHGLHDELGIVPVYGCFLRHPVSRTISHYHHLRNNEKGPIGERIRESRDINHFFETQNHWEFSDFMAKIISGIGYSAPPPGETALSIALRHIDEQFIFVGFQEFFGLSLRRLSDLLQSQIAPERNVNLGKYDLGEISKETLARIEALNRDDMLLYKHCLQKFL